ncbi:MAG: 30S ribosomal protein S8 [Opitutaceae bacterium]|nr:30S ribosomal protein S8 [Opitutaceae bacterium]
MTDPISDFLTRVRNASRAVRDECVSPYSKMKHAIASILKDEGFIRDISEGTDARGHKTLIVTLKYVDGMAAINEINRVSKPGRRLYTKATEIPRVLNGLGVNILSTPKGLMIGSKARKNKLGGEILCNVW